MVWAAPILALLLLPLSVAMGISLDANPEQIAYLFGMGLVGTWCTLVPAKLFENRSLDWSSRRLIALVAGLAVGAVAIVLGRTLQVNWPLEPGYFANSRDLEPLYFGALYTATAGWADLATRGRKKRFRLLPIGLAALLATVLTPLWPYKSPSGIAVAALIACTVQVVSPWSAQAATYARYVRYVRKQQRNVKTA